MKVTRARLFKALFAAVLYAGPLLYLKWAIHEAHFVVVSRFHPGEVSVLDYGAKADGVTDDGAAFEAAFLDGDKRNVTVDIPRGTYLVNRELKISSGMVVRSEGAILRHTTSQINMFSAVSADGWVLTGPLTLVGTRGDKSPSATETGILIVGNSHFTVDKVTVMRFQGVGIKITDGHPSKLAARGRGNHGQFAFISLIDNKIGLEIDDGTGAEYNLFTLLSFSGNDLATRIAGGNNIISTSNVVDNANGVALSSGVNHGHGIFVASNINHNAGFNVLGNGVQQGYTFSACNVYADSPSQGLIELNGSSGIHFSNSQIDAPVVNDQGGVNLITNSMIAGSLFEVKGASKDELHCAGLFGRDNVFPSVPGRACAP